MTSTDDPGPTRTSQSNMVTQTPRRLVARQPSSKQSNMKTKLINYWPFWNPGTV